MSPRKHNLLAALLTIFCGVSHAADPNLLPNGNFSTTDQVSGWTWFSDYGLGSVVWASDDADGDPVSGSLEIDTDSVGRHVSVKAPCFDATPGAAYSMGGQARTISGVTDGANFFCNAFDQRQCGGGTTYTYGFPNLEFSSGPSWTTAITTAGNLAPTVMSLQCIFGAGAANTSALSIRFDNLFFRSAAPTTPVRLQSFDVY